MHADNTVYVTQRGREDDDFAPYIYKSIDGGKTFTSIVGNIPAGPVNVIREDPTNPNVLYVGTDFGAFVTTDGGKQWQVLGGNLPSTQVSDLVYHAARQGHRDLDLWTRRVGDGRAAAEILALAARSCAMVMGDGMMGYW